MIEEYIDKTHLAITEGLKQLKKGNVTTNVYFHVLEEYFNKLYNCVEDSFDTIDANAIARIYSLENSLNQFIIPFKTEVQAPIEVANSDEYLLETIVYFVRKQLKLKESVDFSSDTLKKYDELASNLTKDMADRLGILCFNVNISKTLNAPKNHNICVVKINDSYYLIDCTVQQYFTLGQNFPNRYLKSANHVVRSEIGGRLLKTNKEGSKKLLEKGYISYNSEMFEDYFNAIYDQIGLEKLDKEEYLDLIIKKKKK